MTEIKDHYNAIATLNTTVYALSTDAPDQSKKLKAKMDFPFELLCDVNKEVIESFGLLNPFEHGGIARPAVFIISPDGKIRYQSIDQTAQRVDLAQLISVLSKLNESTRPLPAEKAARRWIIPSLAIFIATFRNLFVMGNFADWKHTLTFPANFIIIPVKKWLRRRKKLKQ